MRGNSLRGDGTRLYDGGNADIVQRDSIVGIELGRADVKVKGYQSHPFGCEMGSQFHQHHVSRGPPIIPDGRVSQVRFGILAFLHGSFQLSEV